MKYTQWDVGLPDILHLYISQQIGRFTHTIYCFPKQMGSFTDLLDVFQIELDVAQIVSVERPILYVLFELSSFNFCLFLTLIFALELLFYTDKMFTSCQ